VEISTFTFKQASRGGLSSEAILDGGGSCNFVFIFSLGVHLRWPREALPFPLAADVVGDDPDRAVLGREVAGEDAAVSAAGGVVVGRLVVGIEVAPVASSMAIEQGGDLVMGHGGGHGGGGDDAAEVVAHGLGCDGEGEAGPEAAPRWWEESGQIRRRWPGAGRCAGPEVG
jgi:hypothetical protein